MEDKKIVFYWNIKKTIVVLCGLLFIPTFLVLLFSFTLKATIVNPQYHKDNLRKINAYNRIINQGIPSLILEMQISDDKLTDSLAKEVAVFLIQKLVNPSWLEQKTDAVIDQTVVFFQDPSKKITLNLTDAKQDLNKLSKNLLIVEELIPACNQGGEQTTTTAFLGFPIDCAKLSVNFDEIRLDIKGIRQQVDKINLEVVRVDQTIEETNSFIQSIHLFMQYLNIYFGVSLVLVLVLILTVIILQWHNPYIAVQAISVFAGVSSLIGLIAGFVTDTIVPKGMGNENIILSPVIRSIANDFLRVTISGVFQYMEICAITIFILSLLSYTCAYLFEHRHLHHHK